MMDLTNVLPLVLSLGVVALATGCFAPGARAACRARRPLRLRCEYRDDPLGIDAKAPRLSWEVDDERRGAVQTAYQILVADRASDLSRNRVTVWNSGKVLSSETVGIAYGGAALKTGRRYFWKVRTWDGAGRPSAYSAPAFWEMGLLRPADWKARWITTTEEEIAVRLRQWIWHPGATKRRHTIYLRKFFEVPRGAKIERAVIWMTADESYTAFLNGNRVGQHGDWDRLHDGRKLARFGDWETLCEYEVTSELREGRNVIAIEAAGDGGPCGLLFGMRIIFADGKQQEIVSGRDWLASKTVGKGWANSDYDTSRWSKVKVVGQYGCKPWGKVRLCRSARSLQLRKAFDLNGKVSRARLFVSGLGAYEMSINGRRVGENMLTPGWTVYPKRIQYQAYDVTHLLGKGENVVGALLGNAWWSGGLGCWGEIVRYSGGPLRCIAQLEIEYSGGKRQTIVTDSTWRTRASPITEDSIYHGERYDARLESPGWDDRGFDDSWWSPARPLDDAVLTLVAQQCRPIRVTQELATAKVTRPAKGVHVFDFGQNMAGWVRLKVKGPRGTRVQIRFAETLKPNGNIYRDNYRSARATDVYILKGEGEEVWEPRFTYRGFRYAELTGYPGAPVKNALTAVVAHSAAPFAGDFECSDELVNRIHRNIVWGQRSNLHSVPTDCPQRDERLGWTGDAQLFGPTACYNMEMIGFFAKWMKDIVDSQEKDGAVPLICPPIGLFSPARGWSDAIVIIPWILYQFYGDRRIIEDNYDAMVAWVEYMRRKATGYLYDRPKRKRRAGAKPRIEHFTTAYFYYSTKLLSRMACAIGRNADGDKYAALSDKIVEALNREYFDPESNTYPGSTQEANILPLHLGIVPPGRREAVMDNVVKDIVSRKHHLRTHFIGTACLLPELTRMGHHDVAWRLAIQRTYPSWGYMIEKGATAIWELWNSDKMGPQMNSRNHFVYGSVGQWFFEAIGGINRDPDFPGFKRIIIHPQAAGDLVWARARYESVHGLIRSAWKIKGGKFHLDVTIPANTTALVYVPARSASLVTEGGKLAAEADGAEFVRMDGRSAVYEIGSGRYRFVGEVAAKSRRRSVQ